MQGILLPKMDRRLQRRFHILVRLHMHAASTLAAGIASLPDGSSAFSATQAAWRFLNNPRVQLSTLVQPLRDVGRSRTQQSTAAFVLLAHDWSKLSYKHAAHKQDLAQLTHENDVGYELTTSLLISADDGSPLAPMEMHMKTAHHIYSTRKTVPADLPHLDQVLPTMRASAHWNLSKPIVHVIDREADSIDRYRAWDENGHLFLVRADERRVLWKGTSALLSDIATAMDFSSAGMADYQGKPTPLWVSETSVVLHRPAKKNVQGRRFEKPGRPLSVRLVIVQLRQKNKVKAQWLLLSNVPSSSATTAHLARCYYWRWRIESFFKLLKSDGQQLERWQQETGAAIARRLLVAAMACVLVWQLQADTSVKAQKCKDMLVRLSGRQMKRRKPHTAPALLTGLRTLCAMLELLRHHDLDSLQELAASIPGMLSG